MTRNFDRRLVYAAIAALVIWLVCLGAQAAHILMSPQPSVIDAAKHGATIHFEADRSAVVFWSDCVQVAWRADNIQALFIGEDSNIGQGTSEQCANDLHLSIKFQDGREATYELPRTVLFDLPNSLITLSLVGIVAYLLAAYFLVGVEDVDSQPAKRREIRPLTSYRGVAAALVFFFHAPVPATGLLYMLQDKGMIGVTFFFVLSGFLIASRYADDIANHTFQWQVYMIRRAARILPVYYAVVIIAALWHEPFFLANLTLTQSYFPEYWSSGIPPAWTLTLEETFYLLLPLILWLCWRTRRRWWVLAGVVVAFYAIGQGLVTVGAYDAPFMLTRTIFGHMIEFMIGVGCAFLYRRWHPGKHAWILTVICCLVFVGWLQILVDAGEHDSIIYGGWVVALLGGGLILSLTSSSGWIVRVLRWAPLVYLGRISYALYLLQMARPIEELRETMKPILGRDSNLVLYLIVTVFCIGLYELVEKPAHNWILRRFNATGSPKAASLQTTGEIVTNEK